MLKDIANIITMKTCFHNFPGFVQPFIPLLYGAGYFTSETGMGSYQRIILVD